MENPLFKRARDSSFCQSSLRELAGHLPAADEDLDRLVAEAVAARDEIVFTHLVLAALDAGRTVDARHLVEGARLLRDPGQLTAVALNCSGNVAEAFGDH